MLTFTPGEMSTVVGPPTFTNPVPNDHYALTKFYNFGDLPYPPSKSWYYYIPFPVCEK